MKKLYTSGPAAFGSKYNLVKASGLPLRAVEQFLQTQNAYTKYRSYRRNFPRLKVIVNDLNEIWSLDLAYVDKLAKYNNNVKYLLVAVDCLSRYVRVQPLKTKFSKEVTEAFRKMIKFKTPKKVWVDKGTEFKGEFKNLCDKRGIHLYSTHSEKKSAFAERNIRSLKNIIYRYLEDKWTYSYITKLPDFVQILNSRTNRVTKLAPKDVKKKHVPQIISQAAENSSKLFRTPKLKIGDYVRIAKVDLPFRKGYKQLFTDEVFEISSIPTFNPPTYYLIDSNGEQIKGKFYQPELQKIGDPTQN